MLKLFWFLWVSVVSAGDAGYGEDEKFGGQLSFAIKTRSGLGGMIASGQEAHIRKNLPKEYRGIPIFRL